MTMNFKRVPESQGWIQRAGEWAVRQRTFMPRMIDLEVSRECNLECPACMRRAPTSLAQLGGEKYRTLESFKEVHRQIPTLGTLNFMGDGEPLMNPELQDIIHYASLFDIHTVVTTNATLITPKTLDHWKANKVYRMHASIDAASKELYEEVRAGASWKQTLENLRLMGKSGIPLCINIVLTKRTIKEMASAVRLCFEVGAKEVTFLMPICAYDSDVDVRPEVNEKNQLLFLDTHWWCNKLGVKWIFPLGLNPTFRRFSFPFIRPQIDIDGELWACCYALGRGRNWVFGHPLDIEPGTYQMGNMIKEGFREVWYGEAYQELREVYKRTEVPKGAVMPWKEYLCRVEAVESRKTKERFDHCEICPARWGIACS